MKLKVLLFTTLSLLLVSQVTFAKGFTLGVMVGKSSDDLTAGSCEIDRGFFTIVTNGGNFTCSVDDSDTVAGINLSYHFTDMWGLELGYIDLGQTSSFLTGPPTGFFPSTGTNVSDPETIDSTALYLAGTVTFDIVESLSLTGRLGGGSVDVDLVSTIFDESFKDDESAVMAGVSLNYSITEEWSAQIRYDYFDYEFFDLEDLSINIASLGITYKF